MCNHKGYLKLNLGYNDCRVHTSDISDGDNSEFRTCANVYICLSCKQIFDIRILTSVDCSNKEESVNNYEFTLYDFWRPAYEERENMKRIVK